MGMYTELFVNVALKEGTPQEVIDTLTYMCSGTEHVADYKSEHYVPKDEPLFLTDRWQWMLQSDSCYTNGACTNKFYKDEYSDDYHLTVLSSFKNYCDEINLFFKWILPHIDLDSMYEKTFIGYHRYEEQELPTFLYIDNETGLLV